MVSYDIDTAVSERREIITKDIMTITTNKLLTLQDATFSSEAQQLSTQYREV